jgi:hypothetical protein
MTDLIVQFACANAENRAEEFLHHLINRNIIKVGVQPETQGNEIWLSFPNIQKDTIRRIVGEAHPWCLDRALGLMQNSGGGEGSQTTVLMIADLARMVE